ncbi:AT-rich interactive domain-containing protein 4A-like [Pseudophryne corroboree]|uniref:AT-rich interactive domain-containing protein 4A-like n=1 Tax=Pseudophryne corroboree TaxID=495146 RepID=UPI003081609C
MRMNRNTAIFMVSPKDGRIKTKIKKKDSEMKMKEKQKLRPQVKSTLQSDEACFLSKTPSSEGKASSKHMTSSMPDNAALSNGFKDSATSEQETAKVVSAPKDQESSLVKPAQTLQQEVEKSEQIVPFYGMQTEVILDIKEANNMPKPKRRRRKAKESTLENTKILPVLQEDNLVEPKVEPEALDFEPFASLQTKELLFAPMEVDLLSVPPMKKKKGRKRKPAEETSPKKELRAECELELPVITAEEKPVVFSEASETFNVVEEEQMHNVNEDMPSLTSELEQMQNTRADEYDLPLNYITRVPRKEETEHIMPMIGPETLVCHKVDLNKGDEQDKIEDMVTEKADMDTQTILVPTLPQSYSVTSPLALRHDESHSIKSESDITIEVDSVVEESQKGLSESESANGFEASTTSSNGGIAVQEAEMPDKCHKRISESILETLAKKQKHAPKRMSASSKGEKNGTGQSYDREDRSALDTSSICAPDKHIRVPKPQEIMRSPTTVTSPHTKQTKKVKHREKHQHPTPRVYTWTLQLNELDNMSGTEKIEFLEDTLQEIRKQYMSLKAEVAAIDRKRIESQNKGRKVYNTRASMSSASSWAGMGSSCSSHKAHCL